MLSAGIEFCDVTAEVTFIALEEIGVRLSPPVSDSMLCAAMESWNGLGLKKALKIV